jgi:hypothetical protein
MTDLDYAKKFINLYAGAKERKIECTMSFKHYVKLQKTKVCFYTGVAFINVDNHALARSMDRIDASLGYTDKNTVACTREFNCRKSNVTISDIKIMYETLQKNKLL